MENRPAQQSTASGHRREQCDACGFDSDLYDRPDTISSQPVMPALLAAAVEGLDQPALKARPDPGTWSIIEYLDHVGRVVSANRKAIEMAVAQPGIDVGAPPEHGIDTDSPKSLELEATLAAVETAYDRMAELLRATADEQWDNAVVLDGRPHDVGWFARHGLHDGLHHLADIGRIRHGLGHGARTQTGSVGGLHVSDGGVPKRAVDAVPVTGRGLDGDVQSDRRHHGRPVQAVCLWSAEVIETLQDEGHPIRPGSAGENITVSGLDWSGLRPGTRVDVGPVPMLITAHAIPCAKNAAWFHDRHFNRILHEENPGSSRLYAVPLVDGIVSVGDVVTVEPPSAAVGAGG